MDCQLDKRFPHGCQDRLQRGIVDISHMYILTFKGTVITNHPMPSVYQQVIERTKGLYMDLNVALNSGLTRTAAHS